MARRRLPSKPSSPQGPAVKNNHEAIQVESGSTSSLNYTKLIFLVLLLVGITGVLYFPRIVSFVGRFTGEISPDLAGKVKSKEREISNKNGGVQNDNFIDEDLELDGHLENVKEYQPNRKQNIQSKKTDSHESDSNKDKIITKETKKDENKRIKEAHNDQIRSKDEHIKGRNGKSKPIILSGENNQIVLDPSQIKFVDTPSEDRQSSASRSTQKPTPKAHSKKQRKQESKAAVPDTREGENAGTDLDDELKNFVPTLQTTFTPKKIFADGRRIPPVELLPEKPTNSSVKVFLFDEFLSNEECEGLMRAHDNHVKALIKQPLLCFDSVDTLRKHLSDAKMEVKVTPNDFTAGTRCINTSFSAELSFKLNSNWSYSTAFYPGESVFSKIASERINRAMGLDPKSGGKFQITSYPVGKAYKEHTDCLIGGQDKRDRVATVLMYLNTVEDGGETRFPELGIWVKPRKGRALVWNNMSPAGDCEPHSKHVASVVKKGTKYILIRWYYYTTFYSIGRRPAPPHLPARDSDQPMVMCDTYNSGSCRWYDEWSYEPLLEYEKNKLTLI